MDRERLTKKVLILGCGNVSLGDDGFGSAVVERLRRQCELPQHAHAEDVGTSAKDVLFNVALLDEPPELIIILDAVESSGRDPGEVFEVSVDGIPERKLLDYSFHQFPSANMLRELRERCGVEVRIIGAQVAGKPESARPGLSEPMRAAVPLAALRVMQILEGCGLGPERRPDPEPKRDRRSGAADL